MNVRLVSVNASRPRFESAPLVLSQPLPAEEGERYERPATMYGRETAHSESMPTP